MLDHGAVARVELADVLHQLALIEFVLDPLDGGEELSSVALLHPDVNDVTLHRILCVLGLIEVVRHSLSTNFLAVLDYTDSLATRFSVLVNKCELIRTVEVMFLAAFMRIKLIKFR